jgi:hypothetical protein
MSMPGVLRSPQEETREAARRRPYEIRPIAKRASDDRPSRVDVTNLKYRAIDRYLNLPVGESFQGADRTWAVWKASQ